MPFTENPFKALQARLVIDDTQAAALLGVSLSTWWKWTRSERTPSAATMRLLEVLDTLHALSPDLLGAMIPPPDTNTKRPRGRPPGKGKPVNDQPTQEVNP